MKLLMKLRERSRNYSVYELIVLIMVYMRQGESFDKDERKPRS